MTVPVGVGGGGGGVGRWFRRRVWNGFGGVCTLGGGGRGSVSPAEGVGRVAAMSAACVTVELLSSRVTGDDNFSVPVSALARARWLFCSGKVFRCGVYIRAILDFGGVCGGGDSGFRGMCWTVLRGRVNAGGRMAGV